MRNRMMKEVEANEINNKIRLIFCQTKHGKYALILCGHATLCKNCGQRFIDENKPHPICRSEIATIIQIFQNFIISFSLSIEVI